MWLREHCSKVINALMILAFPWRKCHGPCMASGNSRVSHWRVDDNRVGFPGFISKDKVMTILRVLRVYYVLYVNVCDYTASASPHLPTISSQPPMLVGNRDFALLEKYRASRGEKCIVQSIERCSHFRLVPCSAPWALKVEPCQGMSRCQNGCITGTSKWI